MKKYREKISILIIAIITLFLAVDCNAIGNMFTKDLKRELDETRMLSIFHWLLPGGRGAGSGYFEETLGRYAYFHK